MQSLSNRVDSRESSLSELEHPALESSQRIQMVATVALQLHLENLEDWSRRNNLRLLGLPEATGTENLAETDIAISHKVLDSPPSSLELE